MQTIVKKYQEIITKLHDALVPSPSVMIKRQLLPKTFTENTLKQIKRINNKLMIVMDNDFAQAIIKKVKLCEKRYSNDFQVLKNQIFFLSSLTQYVGQIQFITVRQRRKIQQQLNKITTSLEYKLNNRMKAMEISQNTQDFRDNFFNILGQNEIEDEQLAKQIYQKFYNQSLINLNRRVFIKIDSIISNFQNRTQILGIQLQTKVNEHFGKQIGRNDKQIQINRKLIERAEQQSLQSNQQNLQRLNQHYEQIKKKLNRFSSMKLFSQQKIQLHLARFGSIVSGFATKNTDMDLTILTNCYINQQQFLKYLKQFLQAEFKKQSKSVKGTVSIVAGARIPLLKIKLQTNKGQSSIDLIVNNVLGVINSKFLSVYASVTWIRYLGILIKLWAKNKQLVHQQKFSSYSLNLLLLHFLIEKKKINLIMDARQRNIDKTPYFVHRRCVKGQQQKFRVYYQFKTQKQAVTSLTRVNIIQLLTQFFDYYREKGQHWRYYNSNQQQSIITVDGSKAKDYDKQFMFTIKDPFDEKHNPGRLPIKDKGDVLKHLQYAYKSLKQRDLDDVMDIFNEKLK